MGISSFKRITKVQMSVINTHADISRKASGLRFGLSLHLHQYFVYVSSEGSAESVHSPEPSLLADAIRSEYRAL